MRFKSGLLTLATGMVRFILMRLERHVELYASPVNFDPRSPMFPISHPWDYANALAREIGTYYTTGMVEDHTGLSNEQIDEDAFLAQCDDVLRERERMMLFELERMTRGFFFCLFDTPDRLQHMFWRFREPGHPANRGRFPENPRYARVIEDHYRACDAIVGRAMEAADDRALFIVLSDHGFTSFQRGVHLNHWLREQGYLALKSGIAPGEEAGEFLGHVDWGRTRAYALGLGSIYLNISGREGEGVVSERDAPSLADSIARALSGLRDPSTGQIAVRGAATRREVYSGPYAGEWPDLVVRFNAGYRASWTTTLGGVPGEQFEDNTRKWGGDHIVDPALVPGVLLMNRPFDGSRAKLIDMAPTILRALGQPKGNEMEGSSLLAD